MLLVASLVSHAGLQNSLKRGRKALLCVEGMHSSKKLVRTRGFLQSAIFTFAETLNTHVIISVAEQQIQRNQHISGD
jgi:hypothetical protein